MLETLEWVPIYSVRCSNCFSGNGFGNYVIKDMGGKSMTLFGIDQFYYQWQLCWFQNFILYHWNNVLVKISSDDAKEAPKALNIGTGFQSFNCRFLVFLSKIHVPK